MKDTKLTKEEKIALYNGVVPIAEVERRKIISDDKVICNTFQLLEQLGFLILRFPAVDGNLSGFYIKKSGFNVSVKYAHSKYNFLYIYF